jgi:Ala-tRNA(Pro) deacylase
MAPNLKEGTMAIAASLKDYLASQGIAYEVVTHPRAVSMIEAARRAGLPGGCVAKGVVLEDRQGYVLAAVPAANKVAFRELEEALARRLELASEPEVASLFKDCDLGAVPPVGAAYGVDTVVDDLLRDQSDIYFEGGDHESLVHVSGEDFGRLMGRARHARISWPKA